MSAPPILFACLAVLAGAQSPPHAAPRPSPKPPSPPLLEGTVKGPDGKQYAVAGEVGVDTSAEAKPQANIDKGQRIQAAALAPADPSPQDHRVAAAGAQLEARGRQELNREADPARDRLSRAYEDGPAPGSTISIYA